MSTPPAHPAALPHLKPAYWATVTAHLTAQPIASCDALCLALNGYRRSGLQQLRGLEAALAQDCPVTADEVRPACVVGSSGRAGVVESSERRLL